MHKKSETEGSKSIVKNSDRTLEKLKQQGTTRIKIKPTNFADVECPIFYDALPNIKREKNR